MVVRKGDEGDEEMTVTEWGSLWQKPRKTNVSWVMERWLRADDEVVRFRR